MIREFRINPKPENNNARVMVTLLGVVGAVVFCVSTFIEKYRGLVALVAMAFIVAALTIAVKYLLSEYTYEVVDADGEWLFVVGQRSGQRYTTLSRVELASIISIERTEAKKREKPSKDFACYSYIPTLMAESFYVMKIVSRYEKAEIALQLTDEMASLLRSYAEEARALSAYDDYEVN